MDVRELKQRIWNLSYLFVGCSTPFAIFFFSDKHKILQRFGIAKSNRPKFPICVLFDCHRVLPPGLRRCNEIAILKMFRVISVH